MDLSIVGSIASVISLLLTLYVFFGIRRIERKYLFRARVPNLIQNLRNQASCISNSLNLNPIPFNSMLTFFAQCEAVLNNISKKLPRGHRKDISELRKALKSLRKNPRSVNSESSYKIYNDLILIITEISNFQQDINWSD